MDKRKKKPVAKQAALSVNIIMRQFIFQKVSFIVPFKRVSDTLVGYNHNYISINTFNHIILVVMHYM